MINFPRIKGEIKITFVFLSLVMFYFATNLYVSEIKQKSTPLPVLSAELQNQVLGVKSQKAVRYLPVRLQIPSIKVDAPVEHIGNNSDGEMGIPSDNKNAGWYELGTNPGEKGSAVISGHFSEEDGKPGLFKDLSDLEPGDMIYVINELGISSPFRVRESRTYNPGYAEEVFSPKDRGAHLNLITCDGIWDAANESFTKRLVVFADASI